MHFRLQILPQELVKNARPFVRRRKANRPKVTALFGESFNDMAFSVLGILPLNCNISYPSFALPTTHKAFCHKEKAVTKVTHITHSKRTAFSYLKRSVAMSNLLALKVR